MCILYGIHKYIKARIRLCSVEDTILLCAEQCLILHLCACRCYFCCCSCQMLLCRLCLMNNNMSFSPPLSTQSVALFLQENEMLQCTSTNIYILLQCSQWNSYWNESQFIWVIPMRFDCILDISETWLLSYTGWS